MNQGVVVIGAGPAGIIATNTLLDSGKIPGNHIILTYTGLDPWARSLEDQLPEGFMGAAFGKDLILAGTPEMGGDLVSYVGQQQAEELFSQVLKSIKNTVSDESKPITRYTPHKHHTITKEGMLEFAKLMWIKFKKAGVAIHQKQVEFQPDVIYSVFEDTVQGVDYKNYIIATGRAGYGGIHNFREWNNGAIQSQINYDNDSHTLIHDRIPDWYLRNGYEMTTRPTSNFEIVDGMNIHAVGDILGTRCIMTAMAQGMAAANHVITNL